MEITGRFLGIPEEGPPLVGLLVQGPGRTLVRWFTPLDGPRAAEWARAFAVGEQVTCSVVLVEDQQRMLIEDMRACPQGGTPGPASG